MFFGSNRRVDCFGSYLFGSKAPMALEADGAASFVANRRPEVDVSLDLAQVQLRVRLH